MSNANTVIDFNPRNPSHYSQENSMDVDSLKISATLFKSAYDNGKKEVETTWGELYEFLVNAPRYPTKKDCEGLKLASFGEHIENTALRNNKNVQKVFGVEIDYDAGEVTTAQAQEIFSRAGLAAIIYTTYGHKPEEGIHKWRALLPLSKPIKGAERLEWWERVNNLVDGKLDPMLATVSQLVFYGNNGKNYEVRKVDGKPIDIAGANIPRRQKDNASAKTVDEDGNEVRIPADERIYNAVSQIFSNTKYYQPALSLTGILHKQGLSKNQAIAMTKALMEAHPNPNNDIVDYIAGVDKYLTTLDAEENSSPFQLLSMSEAMSNLEPPIYCIENLLIQGYLYTLTGKNNSGKTTLASLMMSCISSGRAFGERRVVQGAVLLLSGENSYDTRLKFRVLEGSDNANIYEFPFAIDIKKGANKLIEDITAQYGHIEFRAVFVDSLQAYFGEGDMNSNSDALAVIQAMRKLTGLRGNPTVVALAHPVKNADFNNLVPYGGGSVMNEIDTNLTLILDDGVATLHHLKARQPAFLPKSFKLVVEVVEGMVTNFGESVTTTRFEPIGYVEAEDIKAREYAIAERVLLQFDCELPPSFMQVGLAVYSGDESLTDDAKAKRAEREIKKLFSDGFLEKNASGRYKATQKGRSEILSIRKRISGGGKYSITG